MIKCEHLEDKFVTDLVSR